MIDREREKQAYNDILAWCQTVKEAREELTYQQKRDFLHVMGIVVSARRDETGKVACSMKIELPEIKELIGQNGAFEERFRTKTPGEV